jgi:hypothetical protein
MMIKTKIEENIENKTDYKIEILEKMNREKIKMI